MSHKKPLTRREFMFIRFVDTEYLFFIYIYLFIRTYFFESHLILTLKLYLGSSTVIVIGGDGS